MSTHGWVAGFKPLKKGRTERKRFAEKNKEMGICPSSSHAVQNRLAVAVRHKQEKKGLLTAESSM